MMRINARTVVLDEFEVLVHHMHDDLMVQGYGINEAVDRIVDDYEMDLDPDFEAWLRNEPTRQPNN